MEYLSVKDFETQARAIRKKHPHANRHDAFVALAHLDGRTEAVVEGLEDDALFEDIQAVKEAFDMEEYLDMLPGAMELKREKVQKAKLRKKPMPTFRLDAVLPPPPKGAKMQGPRAVGRFPS